MRPVSMLLLVVAGGCATQDLVVSSGRARYPTYPTTLFAAVESACIGPAESFVRPTRDQIECREFLPPEPTAAIILNFDGTPKDLPQMVIRFTAQADTPGYLVQNEVFLNVPQKTGGAVHVHQTDPSLSRSLDALYTQTGGVPE